MRGTLAQIETLEKMGLTSLQAKIYLSAVKLQKATAGKIALNANVARPDVYRILPMLEKLGLLRKIISAPKMYEATPVKDACDLLLQKKNREYLDVEQRSLNLIEEFEEKNRTSNQDAGNESFYMIVSKEVFLEKVNEADATAKESIDVIGRWEILRPVIYNHLDIYEKAAREGVSIRFITEKPKLDDRSAAKLNKKLGPQLEIRYLNEPLPMRGAIYDGKQANMRVAASNDQALTPSLWSTNSEFTKILLTFFEDLWAKSEAP
jgi:sugar-specific transcriptional regulator TrmB